MHRHLRRRCVACLFVFSACSTAPSSTLTPVSAPPATDAVPARADVEPAREPAAEMAAAQVARGQELFDAICAQCHSVDPPARQAPPMRMVVRHLRQSLGDDDALLAHVLSYVPAPDASRSALPAMAVERFGVMPPQPLPEALLRDIGAYLVTLDGPASAAGGGPMHRGGQGPGRMGSDAGQRHRTGGG